ncbi:MAG: M15 family metallopeptidase [Treponema sp.]|uniref:M15 family metallopeptidase n=1 Tax=Treponema sp. TaxID=166 RepID=UPI003FA32D6A
MLLYKTEVPCSVCSRNPLAVVAVFSALFLFMMSCSPSKTEIKNQDGYFVQSGTVSASSNSVPVAADSVQGKASVREPAASVAANSASIREESLSPQEEKLTKLLGGTELPFSDAKGEAHSLAQNILKHKKAFLADLEAVLAADTENLLIRVDKSVYLDENYVPSALVSLTPETANAGSYVIHRADLALRAPVEKELSRMAKAAREAGVTLVVSSSYRPYSYQKKVYERNVAQMGKEAADRESARPGASQHQLGTVIDFGSITDEYAQTPAGKWLYENAGKYGWSLSFPDGYEYITGYRWECWHYRYVGPLAVRFQEKWFNNIQQYMIEFIHAWKNS